MADDDDEDDGSDGSGDDDDYVEADMDALNYMLRGIRRIYKYTV